MAYTTIDNPELYFQTKLYTGNGSSRSITFDGSEDMQPDWSWFKARSEAYNHALFDSVRGTTKLIRSNQTTAEETHSTTLTAFNSNGFSLGGGDAFTNANSVTYASWNWKAGGSASSNSNGSITSSVSANTTAGFSIVSYTGTGSNATVGHGLSSAPSMIITKNRTSSSWWGVFHASLGNTKSLYLNVTNAAATGSEFWNNTSPTSSVFTVNTDGTSNENTKNYIAYCFAEKKGYSKMGAYTGNGNADGTFVYLGFKPAFVIAKLSSGSGQDWQITDNKRNSFNTVDKLLYANGTNSEVTSGSHPIDYLSNGFKCRGTGDGNNGSGKTYIYMAFAENPFVTSTGIPTTAR